MAREDRLLGLDLVARRADDRCIEVPAKLLSYDDALGVVARLEITAGQRELLLDTYGGKGSG